MRLTFVIFIYFAGKVWRFQESNFVVWITRWIFYKVLSRWMQESMIPRVAKMTVKWNDQIAPNLWNEWVQSRCWKQCRRSSLYRFSQTARDEIKKNPHGHECIWSWMHIYTCFPCSIIIIIIIWFKWRILHRIIFCQLILHWPIERQLYDG